MPKITYCLINGVGEWSDFSREEHDFLTIRFKNADTGCVKINDTLYRVEKGELSIPLSQLPDGTYSLRLETSDGGFDLEKFEKGGSQITMKSTTESSIRRVLFRTREHERKLKDLETKMSILISRTEGHHIFN